MPQGFAARPQIPPSTKPSSPPMLSNPSSLDKSKQEDAFGEKRPRKEPFTPLPRRGRLQPPLLPPARLRLPTAPLRAQRGFDLLLGKRDQRCEKKKERERKGEKKNKTSSPNRTANRSPGVPSRAGRELENPASGGPRASPNLGWDLGPPAMVEGSREGSLPQILRPGADFPQLGPSRTGAAG